METFVPGDNCPRRLLSKETFVQGDFCPSTKEHARTVYWRTQARGKQKYIMRFEIRYFFLEIGLSPSGLTQPQEKSI